MRPRSLFGPPLLLGLCVGLLACGLGAGDLVAIPFGVWASPDGRLDADPSGAHFRFACAAAEIPPPLSLDGDGRFELSGRYEFQVGPEPHPNFPARFTGRVRGRVLTVEVRLQGDPRVVGPLGLKLGAEPPQLHLCC